jgi:hypothetical protein
LSLSFIREGFRYATSQVAGGSAFFVRRQMSPSLFRLWWWKRRMNRVRSGMTPAEVKARLGLPTRRVGSPEIDIWAYDLRRLGDTLYSIRIAFSDERVCQTYLGTELCE